MPYSISDVTPLGRDLQDHDHYPLIAQGNRFFLGGFTNSASDMTGTGRDLFFNVVTWLRGIKEEGDQAWSIFDLRLWVVISISVVIVIAVSAVLLRRRKHTNLVD